MRKNAPPKELPWYLHKQLHPEVKDMLTNYDNLYRIAEIADFMFELIMSKPALSPFEERVQQVRSRIVDAERDRFARTNFPFAAETVLQELGLPVPSKKHLSGSREEVKQVLVDVLSTPHPALQLPLQQQKPLPTITTTTSLTVSPKEQQQNPAVDMRTEDIQMKINEKVQISWLRELESHKTEPASALQSIFDAKKELGLVPHVSIGVRLVNAYMREGNVDRAWESFNAFHKYEHQNMDLFLAGMRVLEKKRNPTRAMTLFEQAEDTFPRSDLPYLYHATMRATKATRQSTWFTFDLYNRMTKVDSLKPTVETLSIVLEACAVLGDVERAKLMWREMVDEYDVMPDEFTHCSMLNTLARGNRMLRAKSLKTQSIKVLTFQDKALLAASGGFINAPIKFTDEVQDVLHELKGFPRDPTNYQSDYDRYRQMQEVAEEYEEELEDFTEEAEEKEEPVKEEAPEPTVAAVATPREKKRPGRDTFMLPGETEEDFMGEDDDDEIEKKKKQPVEQDKKEAEMEEEEIKITGDEHCVFIPGLSPESMPKASELHVKNTYAKLIELRQSNSLPTTPQEIVGTTNGERQEANIQLANQFLADITIKYNQPITTPVLNAHMKVFASALRLRRAQECLALFETHGLRKDVYTYNTLISMYARAQRLPKAFEYFEIMQREGVEINRMTVGPLVDALARGHRVDEAVDMYLEYKNMNLLEKHIRYVRNRLRRAQDPRYNEFPDPNFWRSAENMSTQLHKLNRSKEGMFKQQWIQSMIRS